MQWPEELQGKRVPVSGPPISEQMYNLFGAFGHGGTLTGVLVLPGEKPRLLLEYELGVGIRFQVELAPVVGPVEVRDGDIISGPLEVH